MIKAFTNGFPKHGSHPLVKACQLLGVPARVNHEPFAGVSVPDGFTHSILVKRDPRNALMAWLVMCGLPVTPGMMMAQMRSYEDSPLTLTEFLQPYEGWLTAPEVLIVEYESLIGSDVEMRRIAEFLGTPYLDGAFENLPGGTRTWKDLPNANYLTVWTDDVEAAWNEIGGPALLVRWGY